MSSTQGKITQLYPNNGKPRLVLDNGLSASAFKAEQVGSAKIGDVVSFAYKSKDVNGKTYHNIEGQVAVVSANTAPQGASSQQAPTGTHFERNGAQVGAAINQAIQVQMAIGDYSFEQIEAAAREFLAMGDRLGKFKQ